MLTRKSFVASLDNVKDVNEHYAFIDLHAKQGDLETLKEIFGELCRGQPSSRIPDWASGAVLERVVEAYRAHRWIRKCYYGTRTCCRCRYTEQEKQRSPIAQTSGDLEGRRGAIASSH